MSKKYSEKEIVQLRRIAKRRAQAEGVGLRTALGQVAQELGYHSWKALINASETQELQTVPFGFCKGASLLSIAMYMKHETLRES